ncbi:MAG: GAF domain-containing protein [Anaerolineae bacterium]|nr:GAF domain-containing protein [Anaerolineae bacterium]
MSWLQSRKKKQAQWIAMSQVAQQLTANLDPLQVLQQGLMASMQAVEATAGSFLLLNEYQQLEQAALFHGESFHPADLQLAQQELQEGLAAWVAENRCPLVVQAAQQDLRWLQAPGPIPKSLVGSALYVPLLLANRLLGILALAHREEQFFRQDDLSTLAPITDQLAVMVQNAHLLATEEKRRVLADTLSEIARTLTATLDLGEVLNLILEQLSRVVEYDSASIFLLHGRRLVIRAWRGFENPAAIRHCAFGIEGGHIMARVVAQRDPLVCVDVQQETGWENIPDIPTVHGWIGASLVARGKVVGALTVDSHQPGAYDAENARVVAAFADHAAIAVANARLWQQVQQRLAEVAFLHQAGKTITASLELGNVLHSIMENVRKHFRVDAASVALVEEETGDLVFQAASGAAADEVLGLRLKPGQGVAGWTVRTGQPTLISATYDDERFYRGVDESTGFQTQAMMAVPIILKDQTIGVIEAINPHNNRFENSDLNLLTNVANLAASAIQNARHFTRAREAEQRYTSLFQNSADPIAITDETGYITDANYKLCEMLGYEKSQLIGQGIAFFHDDPAEVQTQLAHVLAGDSAYYTVEAVSRDGLLIPFEVRATCILQGQRSYIQWIYHDLSERQELEKVREDLIHMIVHDLRNPLASILSSLELIGDAVRDNEPILPPPQLLSIAQRSGKRLDLLIDSILDLARLESGAAELDVNQFDVNGMVKESIDQMQPLAAARNLRLTRSVESTLYLHGDRALLVRVLMNLLDNAIKYTPLGGEVQLDVRQEDEQAILFSVADTGPGIPAEYHEMVFDRFARVHFEKARGTGLGLALCKLVVEKHNGQIWVESAADQGATFKFTIPLTLPETKETENKT